MIVTRKVSEKTQLHRLLSYDYGVQCFVGAYVSRALPSLLLISISNNLSLYKEIKPTFYFFQYLALHYQFFAF